MSLTYQILLDSRGVAAADIAAYRGVVMTEGGLVYPAESGWRPDGFLLANARTGEMVRVVQDAIMPLKVSDITAVVNGGPLALLEGGGVGRPLPGWYVGAKAKETPAQNGDIITCRVSMLLSNTPYLDGYEFLTDDEGNFLTDEEGNFLYAD